MPKPVTCRMEITCLIWVANQQW